MNPISNIPNKCGTKKKREDPKKKTSAKKQVSQKIFKSNYDHDSVKRTSRVVLSSIAVPQSVDMAGNVLWFMRRKSDKCDTRAGNGKGAHCRYIDARFL